MAFVRPQSVVHAFDYLADKISSLFRFHNRSQLEKAYAVILYLAGPSLRKIIAVLVSRSRFLLNALIFLKMVLKSCENRPLTLVDRGPWYLWALRRLGLECVHETFGKRNRIEGWFREMKDRTKRFCNNVNDEALKSIEGLVV